MDRLERLVNLVATLLAAERPLRAAELRERVPGYPEGDVAFHRAFNRDKATLRSMDVPVTVEYLDPGDPDAGQGYRIPRQRYELPDLGLEAEEVAALQLASTAVRLDGDSATEAIWKLGGVGSSDRPDTAPVGTASLPGSEHLAMLFAAAAGGRTVRFDYKGVPRTVDPWQLSFRNGYWYLAGWDHDRHDSRSFRLDRVTSAPEAGATFVRPAQAHPAHTMAPWEMGDEDPVIADVRVDADQARWALATAGASAQVERGDDGVVILRLHVTNRSALRTFVLGMLDHAELLSPPAERAELVAWVRAGREGWR